MLWAVEYLSKETGEWKADAVFTSEAQAKEWAEQQRKASPDYEWRVRELPWPGG